MSSREPLNSYCNVGDNRRGGRQPPEYSPLFYNIVIIVRAGNASPYLCPHYTCFDNCTYIPNRRGFLSKLRVISKDPLSSLRGALATKQSALEKGSLYTIYEFFKADCFASVEMTPN